MAEDKVSNLIKRGAIIQQILEYHGYKLLRTEDNFEFYSKELIDKPSFREVFGYNYLNENSIITFFGIETKYPISCDCELERLGTAIRGGYEVQKIFNGILASQLASQGV